MASAGGRWSVQLVVLCSWCWWCTGGGGGVQLVVVLGCDGSSGRKVECTDGGGWCTDCIQIVVVVYRW